MRNDLRLCALSALLTAACSGDSNGSDSDAPDTGTQDVATDSTDSGGDAGETTDTAPGDTDGSETDGDVVDEGSEPAASFEETHFFECDVDADCTPADGREQICVFHVCVIPPTTPTYLADDEDGEPIEYTDRGPVTACYTTGDGLFTPAGEDRLVSISGKLERFGSGPTTTGLCVTAYDELVLLPWQIQSECNLLADVDDDAYIACFQLDPCRCAEHFSGATSINEPMVEAAAQALELKTGSSAELDSLDACYGFVGYCDAIEDTTVADACRARVRANGNAPDATTLVLGTATTSEDPDDVDLDEPEGTSLFTIPNIRTNTRFAFKVSGRENRWRDTWEYGLFSRGDKVTAEGEIYMNATVLSDGSWRTIPAAVGLAAGIDDTHGAVAGAIRDCGDGDRNPWAIVHATVGISFNQGSVLSYFNANPDDTLPLPGRTDTNLLGTYAAIDLPPGPNRVAPVICLNDCSARENFIFAGGKNVFQTPKSVIIATFEGYFQE